MINNAAQAPQANPGEEELPLVWYAPTANPFRVRAPVHRYLAGSCIATAAAVSLEACHRLAPPPPAPWWEVARSVVSDLITRPPTWPPSNVGEAVELVKDLASRLPTPPPQWREGARWLYEHRRPIQLGCAVVAAGCAVVAGYRWYRSREREEELDPYAQPTSVIEVSPDIAQGVPVSFACPVGLRDLVRERCLLLERTPALCQKIKSIAGRWCDEHGVTPDRRPGYIAGAVAACMSVPEFEQHLILFENGKNVQELYKRVRMHQHASTPEQRKMRLLDWLTRPGRR